MKNMTRKTVKGIVTYLEKNTEGRLTWFRLNSRTWAYLKAQAFAPVLQYGNTVEITGVERCNGKRHYLLVDAIRQIKSCDLSDISKKIGLLNVTNINFYTYLYHFKRSLYKKFISWPYSKQSAYSLNPYKLYLNGYLDYHTAKALADVTAPEQDFSKQLPAVIKYLLEEALSEDREYRFTELVDLLKTKYPSVTPDMVIEASKQAGALVVGNSIVLRKIFHARQFCLSKLSLPEHYPLKEDIARINHELADRLTSQYVLLTGSRSLETVQALMELPGITVIATTNALAQRLSVKTTAQYTPDCYSATNSSEILIIVGSEFLTWWSLKKILQTSGPVIFEGDLTRPFMPDSAFKKIGEIVPVVFVGSSTGITCEVVSFSEELDINKLFKLFSQYKNIIIVTPMVVGPWGTKSINTFIHRRLHGTDAFVPGTPVIVKKNYPELPKASVGKVIASNGDTVECIFNDKKIRLKTSQIDLAYAISAFSTCPNVWDYVIAVIPDRSKLRHDFIDSKVIKSMISKATVKAFVFGDGVNSFCLSSVLSVG